MIGKQNSSPSILPVRKRSEIINQILKKRLDGILPMAMRQTGFDMWLVLCQEDDLDPAFRTLIPMDTWCPILQILVFYDRGSGPVERINISGTFTGNLYDWPYKGQLPEKQWPLLKQIVEERDPRRIGINIGSVKWAGGGLTLNLYKKLAEALSPKYVDRLTSAEPLVARYLATLTKDEIILYEHVVSVAHHLLAECYSPGVIVPGATTIDDVKWYYWQRCTDLGISVSFKPYFRLVRSKAKWEEYGAADQVIRPGDFVHSDVGISYLRLQTDHQQWLYVLRPGEDDAPEGAKRLMGEANRLQDIFMAEMKQGLTGNDLLRNILSRARNERVPNPRVYSHSLGLFLHEPGPLIGLPWEQEKCIGRGDVKLEYDSSFAMELSIADALPEWGGEEFRLGLEEDVVFTEDGCRLIYERQTEFYLV